MENCSFTVGRKGNISIEDQTVSRNHVEIQVRDGAIYLRDLSSTNGTFLLINNRHIPFVEGYVQPYQVIVLGMVQCRVQKLLELAKKIQGNNIVCTSISKNNHSLQLNQIAQKNRFSIWM